jgi:tetratricopeptide (TPR) repeat protein
MGDSADGNERPDDEAAERIRAGLGRVLSSEIFRAAPQLAAFLAFIVERTLEGRRSELKGYTIAVEALGRPPEFDPQSDPIVRVEAGRLRRALTQYYTGQGRDDPLRIAIPVGGYIPAFDLPAPGAPDPAGTPGPQGETRPGAQGASAGRSRRRPLAALAAVICLLLAFAAGQLGPRLFGHGSAGTQVSTPAPDLPTVAIVVGPAPSDPALADLVQRSVNVIVDVMARFDDLVIVKVPPLGAPIPEDADYVLELNMLASDGTAQAFGRLRTVKDGRIIWTSSSERPLRDVLEDQDLMERIRRVAARLVEPFGVIHADGRQNPVSPAAACIYQALDDQRSVDAERHEAARSCLERIIARDPGFYPARARMATLLLRDYASGREDKADLLDRGLAAALAAQRLAPSSSRAQQMVAEALFLRGEQAEAEAAARAAMTRNPYDPHTMALLGAIYVRMDRPSDGLPLLERALELSPGRPPWYDFFAYLAAYRQGLARQARTHFAALAIDSNPLGLLARALEAAKDDDTAARDEALRQLAAQVPLFGREPQRFLARKGFAQPVTMRLLDDLGLAGGATPGNKPDALPGKSRH